MVEIDSSLMLEPFRRIHEDIGGIEGSLSTVTQRFNALSTHQAGFHVSDAVQDASIAEINIRLDRMERRLALRDDA